MVILMNKFYSKLDKHQNRKQDALTASLQEFLSDLSDSINQISSLSSKPGFEILSLPWMHQFFLILPMINKAFAKLVVNLDHHVEKWEAESIQAYLKYSLDLLDLLNSVTSSLSHWTRLHLSLSLALSLVGSSSTLLAAQQQHLKAVGSKTASKFNKFNCNEEIKEARKARPSGAEKMIRKALVEVKSITFFVCSTLLCGLSGNSEAYLEMRKSAEICNSSLINLDCILRKEIVEKGCMLKEAKEMSDAVFVQSYAGAEEIENRLAKFGRKIEEMGKDVDCLFSQVLAGRRMLLDSIRHQKEWR